MTGDPEAHVVLENDHSRLLFHPRSKIVHHELRAVVQAEAFREILERGLELFIEHGARKWLSDDRGNGPLTPEDAEWASTSWAPRVVAAGWKFWAVVMPQRRIGQVDMTEWIQTYAKKGVTVAAFLEPDRALHWLTVR